MGIVCSKIECFCRKLPITCSTCILTFAIVLIFSTSYAGNLFLSFVKAGISNLTPTEPNIAQILNPLYAITVSPWVNFDKKIEF